MPEPRTPVMIVVEASWEDLAGALQTACARMEDKSANGACIRLKRPVDVGTRMRIQWRFEQFSGVVKYCRSEGRDFIVGMQKDNGKAPLAAPAGGVGAPTVAPKPLLASPPQPVLLPPQPPALPESAILKPQELTITTTPTQIELIVRVAGPSQPPLRAVRYQRELRRAQRGSRIHAGPVRRTESKSKIPNQSQIVKGKEASPERKTMKRKWLDLAAWRSKPESQGEASFEAGKESGAELNEPLKQYENLRSEKKMEKEKTMSTPVQPAEKTGSHPSREVPAFQVELLPTEEIYRAAGITMPRRGYSVSKVIEMVNSEHIRALSKEMKRAAVLMALDAAGISVDQIQRDAKARQDALDIYEASQKKQAEAEWARKAEEITQIQSELESIKAHYSARISRCTEALARDKARFSTWVTSKEQESRNMAEAVELCMKPSAESATPAAANAASAGAGSPGTKAQ